MTESITISIPSEYAKLIREFCKKEDMSISAVLRKGALELIARSKNE